MDTLVEEKRFQLVGESTGDRHSAFAEDVLRGLRSSPKAIPPCHLYDAEGSRLFEAICAQPEYYLTRTEAGILTRHAQELVEHMGARPELVELGSGSAEKTRILLRAFLEVHDRLRFLPIDISSEMLEASSRALLSDFEGLEVEAIVGDYVAGLRELGQRQDVRVMSRRKLVLWLGSSVGNLPRGEAIRFLRSMREFLAPGDAILIGVDYRKGRAALEAAYDDAGGVSARFAKNLLVRINRELGGNFDPDAFAYRATYDKEQGFVDMCLVSRERCSVRVDALSMCIEFEAGEMLRTETSHKYSRTEIEELARSSDFRIARSWSDDEDRFSLNLFVP